MAVNKGFFITLEGGEGSGKSTQIKALAAFLKKKNHDVLITREPGGDKKAELIRKILLNGSVGRWDAISETLLFQVARISNANNVILPALASGKTVISDRFTDSTLVYQGICKGVGTQWVKKLFDLTLPNIKPDITLLLDIDPKIGLKRASVRNSGESRFESMGLKFHTQVREGFLSLAKKEPKRIKIINASSSANIVYTEICTIIESHLG
jgi:dTMP kinase